MSRGSARKAAATRPDHFTISYLAEPKAQACKVPDARLVHNSSGGIPGPETEHARQQPDQSSGLRHVSSAESRELHEVGFDLAQAGPDATSGPVTR